MRWRAVGFVVVGVWVGVGVGFAVISYWADHHRTRVNGGCGGGGCATPVLVAKRLIPKGTPGVTLATNSSMYGATTLPSKDIEVGAIADPSYLRGRAATVDILPGEQIIASDFASAIHGVPSMTVLVATEPILKGTPGSRVVANGMYRATVSRPQDRQVGAISDPAYLKGRESVADIQLGQQLTEANFPAGG